MESAKNAVIAGDYNGGSFSSFLGSVSISYKGNIIDINNQTVESYELLNDEHKKSLGSGVARGLIGGALFEPVGMIAGGVTAKSKGIYQVAILFKDGKKSLIEVNDKLYKLILQKCF